MLPSVHLQYELREGKRRKMEQERREREERERKEREEQERQEQLERIRRQEEEEIRRREEEEARRRSEEREAAERARQGDEAVVSVEAEAEPVSRLPPVSSPLPSSQCSFGLSRNASHCVTMPRKFILALFRTYCGSNSLQKKKNRTVYSPRSKS